MNKILMQNNDMGDLLLDLDVQKKTKEIWSRAC
jgi:hypothetical protein